MLDPSSSEEEDEVVEEERKVTQAPKAGATRVSPSRTSESPGGLQPSRTSNVRPTSPGPSAALEKEKDDLEKMQREEDERKKRLQLYVFVMRCIAYPFNAKQPTDMARRQQKVRPQSEATDCLPNNKTLLRESAASVAARAPGALFTGGETSPVSKVSRRKKAATSCSYRPAVPCCCFYYVYLQNICKTFRLAIVSFHPISNPPHQSLQSIDRLMALEVQ